MTRVIDHTEIRRRMRVQSVSITAAVAPFGFAFGVTCAQIGIRWFEAAAFSTLVFSGGAQFAAVGVLKDHGSAATAVTAGLLLSVRLLAYGVVLAPSLAVPFWKRALLSQYVIDETMAVATSHRGLTPEDRRLQRYGFAWCGTALFLGWNVATLAGVLIAGSAGEWIERLGVDATIPASFLALIWPRLSDPVQRRVAAGGAILATALIPVAPPGVPIIAAALAVGLAGIGRGSGPGSRLRAARRWSR